MQTGTRGTFVISWTQTEVDGVSAAPRALLVTGASWRWTGAAVRVDGPQTLLMLAGDPAGAELRRHVARTARRLAHSVSAVALGAVSGAVRTECAGSHDLPRDDLPPLDHGVVLTDGRRSYEALLIPAAGDDPAGDLLAFVGALIGAPAVAVLIFGAAHATHVSGVVGLMVLAGLLVGFGTRMANGCTSGHGVCGISRFSARSIVATLVYLGVGFVTLFLARHVLGVI